jgi:hypothetical protein
MGKDYLFLLTVPVQQAFLLVLLPSILMGNELSETLKMPKRKLVVSLYDIALDKTHEEGNGNIVFILMVEESRGSAGGRGGGSGSRRIDKIVGFREHNTRYLKIFETENQDLIERFDIPYNAVAMDITLEAGEPYVVQGVVDREMIGSYMEAINNQ